MPSPSRSPGSACAGRSLRGMLLQPGGATVRMMQPTHPARVCILGAESTGKTTLAAALAARFETVWNPEYGRVYTRSGERRVPAGRAWSSPTSRGCTAGSRTFSPASPTVCSSPTRTPSRPRLPRGVSRRPADRVRGSAARRYDLYVVCGLDVPFVDDGWREFEEQRRWMHERLLGHARDSGSAWIAVEGAHEARLMTAADAVERLLA